MSDLESHHDDSSQANTILALCWSSGTLAACFYDVDQLELYAVQQAAEPRPQYPLARNLIRQYRALFYVVSGSKHFLEDINELLDVPEHVVLQNIGTGKIEPHEKARFCEFSSKGIKNSFARVLSLSLPGMPPQASQSERQLFLESILPFNQKLLIHAVGCLLKLLDQLNLEDGAPLVTGINVLAPETQLIIDELTYQSLQIFNSRLHPSGFKWKLESSSCSVFNLFNRCSSKMGTLELMTMMQQPIRDLTELNQRFNTVGWLAGPQNDRAAQEMRTLIGNLTKIQIVYRKIHKKSTKNGDWKSLKKNIYYTYLLCKLCLAVQDPLLEDTPIESLSSFVSGQDGTLKELLYTLDSVVDLERGDQNNKFTVKRGIDPALDQMRRSFDDSQIALLETSRMDIENLPIDMNNLFVTFLPDYGYVFSSTKSEEFRDPSVFERSSMVLVLEQENSVYFQNNMCKELNVEFGNLLANINDRENAILTKLVAYIDEAIPVVFKIYKLIAKLDVLLAFASVAVSQEYTRPTVADQKVLQIKLGRHALMEQFKMYRPNETDISSTNERFVNVIASTASTGKTIYLKEIALICYLAHIGSFVPAQVATIGLLDSIYSRLDYPETIFSGKSSFMGELYQMSNILLNTTSKSLVLIDEFGKGTTYSEGKSLLIASIEHVLRKQSEAPITLVATQFTGIVNYLHENRFLRVQTPCLEDADESRESSTTFPDVNKRCREDFTNAFQTMTLGLVKQYLSGEFIDPATLVHIFTSVPIAR